MSSSLLPITPRQVFPRFCGWFLRLQRVWHRHKKSGLLMLVNMQNREIWISTCGDAIDIFTDNRISIMEDNVIRHLSNNDYYSACQNLYQGCQKLCLWRCSIRAIQVSVRHNITYADKVSRRIKSVSIYITALVISLGATLILSLSSKERLQ